MSWPSYVPGGNPYYQTIVEILPTGERAPYANLLICPTVPTIKGLPIGSHEMPCADCSAVCVVLADVFDDPVVNRPLPRLICPDCAGNHLQLTKP